MAAVMVLSCGCLKTVFLNTRVDIIYFWALALSSSLLFSLWYKSTAVLPTSVGDSDPLLCFDNNTATKRLLEVRNKQYKEIQTVLS